MKYCIYRGDLYKVEDIGKMLYLKDDNNEVNMVSISDNGILEVSEVDYKVVEDEYDAINTEIRNIRERLNRLEDEFYRKKNLLHEMYLQQRCKQNGVISRLITASRKGDYSGDNRKVAE